jgi:tetratricopeptide (TPR) repeat protein
VTPVQIGQQLGAACVLTGSLRRAGSRLRITTQLVDAKTDFPLWSERYDRQMEDVFELQDEIARKIAEALRVTLSPQEQEALAAKPTEDLEAYDLYLRGKSFVRRLSGQDLEAALQMFESAVARDPGFALAHAAIANACAQYHLNFERADRWIERAVAASKKASSLGNDEPEIWLAEAWIRYTQKDYDPAIQRVREVIDRKPDCEGAYNLLGRALFSAGRYQETVDMADAAIAAEGEDYNIFVPVINALGALGKTDAARNLSQQRVELLESHLKKVPEDARGRMLLSNCYAHVGRSEDAERAATLAMTLRPNDALVLYNVACLFGQLGKKPEALDAIKKAWEAGYKERDWARRDPDLAILHGDPEFEKLFPPDPDDG